MNENKELTTYEQDVIAILDEIKDLFLYKNRNYNGESPFANFILGGLLLHGDSGFPGCFEALKAYTAKHIANLYTHNINAPGLDEPMRDIATYMVIGIAMKRQHDLMLAKQQQEPMPEPDQEPGQEQEPRLEIDNPSFSETENNAD